LGRVGHMFLFDLLTRACLVHLEPFPLRFDLLLHT
jgi:hypothetical protein